MNKMEQNKFQLYDIRREIILDYDAIEVENLFDVETNTDYIKKNFTGYLDCLGNEIYDGDIIFNPATGIELLSYVAYDENYDEYMEVTGLIDEDTYEKLYVFIDSVYVIGNTLQNDYNELQRLNFANFIQLEDIHPCKRKFKLYDYKRKKMIEHEQAKKFTIASSHSKRYCKLNSTGEIDSNGFEIYDCSILYDIDNCGLYSFIHYNKEIGSYQAITIVDDDIIVHSIEKSRTGHIVGCTKDIDYKELVKLNDYKQTLNIPQVTFG